VSKLVTARADRAGILDILEKTKPELGWHLILHCLLETAARPSEVLNLRRSQATPIGDRAVEFVLSHKNEWRKGEKKTLLFTGEIAKRLQQLMRISASDAPFTAQNV